MLRDAWFLTKKDAGILLKQRENLLWTFIMPVVFFYFIGAATGGSSGGAGPALPVVAISGDEGFAAKHLQRKLEDAGYDIRLGSEDPWWRRLTLESGFSNNIAAHEPVTAAFRSEAEATQQLDEMRVQRAAYAMAGDIIAIRAAGNDVTEATLAEISGAPPAIKVAVETAGRRERIPTGFEQSVPGTTVMFVLLVMLTTTGVTLVTDRRNGLLRRLASSPMPRVSVVAGKWGARMLIGLVQLAFAMTAGWLLFGVTWGGANLWAVALVLILYVGLCASLGVAFGAVARTEGQAIGFGVLGTNLLGALGGCWWPIEVTPQ